MRSNLYKKKSNEKITILGIGSLLLEEWARKTCPTLSNFRLVELSGYKRVFNKTDSFLIRNDLKPIDSKAYASLSAVPVKKENTMVVSAFEISISEWAYFVQREFEYRLIEVPFTENGVTSDQYGVLCVGDYKSDEECEMIVNADPLRLQKWKEFRAKYDGPMWRDDLLPEPEYLDVCLDTAKACGDKVYQNFIDTTFVGDGRSIRNYICEERL